MHSALLAGSERRQTAAANGEAYAQLGLAPRAIPGPGPRELGVTVLGQRLSLPVLLSPTGVQAVHPDGELAVARAAAACGTALGLSCFASKPVEEVCAVGAPTLVQLHWIGGRAQVEHQVDRARAAGAAGLVLTSDWSFSQGRDGGSPRIPERVDARTALHFAPEVAARPRWLARWVRAGRLPDLTVPNLAPPGGQAPTFFSAYRQWVDTPLPTWDDVAWLRGLWDAPFLLKGVTRVDDARRAVDAGVSAVSVSNHGGNNLDGTPAAVRALSAIVDAVGHEVEVLTDGGIRWGSDVVKALALGARAVLLGRGYLWGLAAGGQAGVVDVLEELRCGITRTLVGLGRASVHELTRDDLVVPPGFDLALGAS